MEAIEALTKRVPARTEVTFAEVTHGGTGRFDLAVHTVDGELVPVVHQLSRGQAETAAALVNRELGRHFDDQDSSTDHVPTVLIRRLAEIAEVVAGFETELDARGDEQDHKAYEAIDAIKAIIGPIE